MTEYRIVNDGRFGTNWPVIVSPDGRFIMEISAPEPYVRNMCLGLLLKELNTLYEQKEKDRVC